MNIDEYGDQLLKNMLDIAKAYDDGITEQLQGRWDASTVTDAQHADWFVMKRAQDPLWPVALKYVEGGPKEIKRFQRTLERVMAGEMDAGPLLAQQVAQARAAAMQAMAGETGQPMASEPMEVSNGATV